MKKMTGIVSELPQAKVVVKEQVELFTSKFRVSNAVHFPKVRAIVVPSPIERLKSFVIGLTITTFLVGAVTLGLVNLMGVGQDSLESKIEWVSVSVSHGDTIWDLIRERKVNESVDTRTLVSMTKSHNKLSSGLKEGMTIQIPVMKEVK